MTATGLEATRDRPRAKRVFPVPGSPRSMKTIPLGFSGLWNMVPIGFLPTVRAVRTESAGEGVPGEADRAVLLVDVFVRARWRDTLPDPVGGLFEGPEVPFGGELVGVAEVLLDLPGGGLDVADRPAGRLESP